MAEISNFSYPGNAKEAAKAATYLEERTLSETDAYDRAREMTRVILESQPTVLAPETVHISPATGEPYDDYSLAMIEQNG